MTMTDTTKDEGNDALLLPGTPVVWKTEEDERKQGVVHSVEENYVLIAEERVRIDSLLARGVGPPGTWAEDMDSGVRGIVLGYRYADGTTAIKPDNGGPVVETRKAGRVADEVLPDELKVINKRRAVAVVEAVCRSLLFASEAAKSQLEKLSLERPSQMREALSETKAGAAAVDGVAGTVAEAMKRTTQDGAVAALGDAARRLQAKASTTDFEAMGKRLAAKLLSDERLLEDAFSRLLPKTEEVTEHPESVPLSRELARATVTFVSSKDVNALNKEMGVKVVEMAGRPAFERAVEAALRAADEDSVAKVLEAADMYRGPLGADLMTKPEAFLSQSYFGGISFASSTQGVLGKSSQDYALEYVKKLAQGASLTETLTSALDDERAVSGVHTALQSPAVAKLADMIASFDSDARAKHFAERFKDADGILDRLADGWDLDASVTLRTLVQGKPSEKKALIDKANDAALGFFLQHLPAMPVPDLEVEKDGVLYQVSNLNLSNLNLVKRDVDVDFPLVGAASEEEHILKQDEDTKQTKSATGNGSTDFFDDARLDEDSGDRASMIVVKARRVSAKLDKLQWRFKQTFFPYLEGSGYADVDVDEASMRLDLAARRISTNKEGENKPIVAATRCQVEIGHLELTIESHREGRLPVAWLLNAMSSLFREQVREYVRDSIEAVLARQLVHALVSLDDVIDGAWPMLARLFPAALPADILKLAPCKEDEDEAAESQNNSVAAKRSRALLREQRRRRRRQGPARSRLVRITLDEPGPLGLELAVSNSKLALRGIQPQGQAARFLANRRLRLVEGSTIVAVDDVPLTEITGGMDAIIKRVTAAERPKRISFELPLTQASGASVAATANPRKVPVTKATTALAIEKFELCPASQPDRAVASLGIKLRRHAALDEAVELAEAPPGTAPVGAILVACSGAPRLCAPIGRRASPASVGNAVKLCLQATARSGRAFSITVAASPDNLISLPAQPSDLLFQVATAGAQSYFVLAGLSDVVTSPLESAGAMTGDLVTRINDQELPTPHGYAHDVGLLKQAVSQATAEKGTFSLVLKRIAIEEEDISIRVTPASYTAKLGATFTRCQDSGRPKLKRFDGIPGPVALTCTAWKHLDLRPGLALVALDNRRLDPKTISLADLEALLFKETSDNKQRSAVFRQVEAYDELVTRFAAEPEKDIEKSEEQRLSAASSDGSPGPLSPVTAPEPEALDGDSSPST